MNILVVYYVHNYHALEAVKDALDKAPVKYTCIRRKNLSARNFRNRDLVITVGGDGTFLRAARYLGETPILSVCSDRTKNESFFARAHKDNFSAQITKVLANKYHIVPLTRLQATLNGKALPLAVNEYFIGSKRPSHTSLYTLHVGGKKEYQKSSGVLINTPAGSHGWAGSAGATRLSLESTQFQYLVREPYRGRLTDPKLVGGTLSSHATIKIISDIFDGVIVVDSGFHDYRFVCGDVVEISVGEKLRFVDV